MYAQDQHTACLLRTSHENILSLPLNIVGHSVTSAGVYGHSRGTVVVMLSYASSIFVHYYDITKSHIIISHTDGLGRAA